MKIKPSFLNKLNFFLISLLAVNSALAASCGKPWPIKSKPILFNKERIELTKLYLQQHYGIQTDSIEIVPKIIVLHWTGGNFKDSYAFFFPPLLSGRPELIAAGSLNVSAQYLVDRDGTIYRLMPDHWMARHVIGLNANAIGIENAGGVNDAQDLTSAQVGANAYLICKLKNKYPSIQYLIGHYEYEAFRHTPLWLEKDPNYITQKVDPGPLFLAQVRQKVKNLGLLSRYSGQ